ncbi:DUF6380 family protein [Streptomyces sp. NPDC004542]
MDLLGEEHATPGVPGARQATPSRGAASLTATVHRASFQQYGGPAQEDAR